MNPSSSLRIDTMMRTLQETILPAIREDQPLAKEQASLMLGHLAALRAQDGREAKVDQQARTLLESLCDELIALSADESALRAIRDELTIARKQRMQDAMAFCCERMLAVVEVRDTFKQASFASLLRYAKAYTTLGRVWFRPMGFDSNPADLPVLEEVLSSDE